MAEHGVLVNTLYIDQCGLVHTITPTQLHSHTAADLDFLLNGADGATIEVRYSHLPSSFASLSGHLQGYIFPAADCGYAAGMFAISPSTYLPIWHLSMACQATGCHDDATSMMPCMQEVAQQLACNTDVTIAPSNQDGAGSPALHHALESANVLFVGSTSDALALISNRLRYSRLRS